MDSIGSLRNLCRKHKLIVFWISSRVTFVLNSKAAKALAALVQTISPRKPSIPASLQI